MRRIVLTVTLLIALLGACLPASAALRLRTFRKGPVGLAFYTPPKGFAAAKAKRRRHGSLIWARRIQSPITLPSGAATYLVLYRSKSVSGKTIAVSGSVTLPRGKPPRQGWPVISYAHGTTGSADVCAPSRDSLADTVLHLYSAYAYPTLDAWVKAGYAVLRTDYEGLGTPGPHPYLIGTSEGRGVIDIVRAARQLSPSVSRRWAIAGHSQGGHAALWAAALAPNWAPELALKGVVAFAPASHVSMLVSLAPALTSPGGGLSALGALLFTGAGDVSSAVTPSTLLSDQAAALLPQVEQKCLPALGKADSFGGLAPSQLLRPGASTTAVLNVLNANDPGRLRIKVPALVLQGDRDATVFPAFTLAMVKQQQALGDNISETVVPGIDHAGIVSAGSAQASAFFQARFARP